MFRLAWIAAALLAFSGCLSAADGDDRPALDATDDGDVDLPQVDQRGPGVQRWDGRVTGVGGCSEVTGATMAGSFRLPEDLLVFGNASTLLIEVRWEPTPMDVCLSIRGPLEQRHYVTPEFVIGGTGHIRFQVDAPTNGVWNAIVLAQGAANIDFKAAASVFYGEVPADYTALA